MRYNNPVVSEDLGRIVSSVPNISTLKNSTVLITGANGMLATYLVYTLLYLNDTTKCNTKVVALVRNGKRAEERFGQVSQRDDLRLLVQDVCAPISINESVDYIIHAAGNASPRSIVNDPVGIISANTVGTLNVLEFAREKQVKCVLFTSTREVYGKTGEGITSIKESDYGSIDSLEARSCYPESKRIAETLCKSYYVQHGLPFKVVRIAHAYGPGMVIENDGRVMADFIGDVVANRHIVLKSDGSAERAFCYISDAITAIFTVMLNGRDAEAYNLANETQPLPIGEVARMLVDLFPEKELKVKFDLSQAKSNMGYSKIARVGLDTSKLNALGWTPRVKLEEGLYRTVKSFQLQT